MKEYTIAFAGNPNTGKSAWINALSHSNFQVGNLSLIHIQMCIRDRTGCTISISDMVDAVKEAQKNAK